MFSPHFQWDQRDGAMKKAPLAQSERPNEARYSCTLLHYSDCVQSMRNPSGYGPNSPICRDRENNIQTAGMLLMRTQSRAHHAAWTRHIPSDDRPGYATSHADWVLFARASAFGSPRSDRDDLVSVNFAWRKSRMAISRISDLIRQVIIGATCCDARCAGRWRTADELRLKKQGRGSRHTSIHRKRRIIQWV